MHDRRPCPRCEIDLVERKPAPGALLACGRCGGVWLDVDACRHVVQCSPAAASLLSLAERSDSVFAAQPPETLAACPACGAQMQRRLVAGTAVAIDTCIHGTWFDARELRIVAAALEGAVRPAAPAPPPATANSPPRTYGQQFDSDTVEMFGELARSILRVVGSVFNDDQNRFP